MAGVRSKDKKGGIVPYVSAPNSSQPSAAAGNSSAYTKGFQGDGGKWDHDVGAYFGNEGGSGHYSQGKNYSPGPGNYGPSASGSNFGSGGGKAGGNGFSASAPPTQRSQQPGFDVPRPNGYPVITNTATSGSDFQPTAGGASSGNGYGPSAQNGFGSAPQNFSQIPPQRSQQPGGPVSDGYPVINNDRGNGGGYVAAPEPVRRYGGSEPNGWITNGGPGYQQQGGNEKPLSNGGGGGPHGYGGQNGSISGSERHHHHYYYQNNPVPYYNNNPQVEEKKRRRGLLGPQRTFMLVHNDKIS
ncbi:hypothetical protein R1sor_004025 [Riccia sorocarpa]|uniref:Uncharacterized protein n=1 Tax=Riccia sorocarpa TaxID=122646 RepID=A0ABD3H421_9MARC